MPAGLLGYCECCFCACQSGWLLLVAGWQLVGNTLVAVDAGHIGIECFRVELGCFFALLVEVHELEAVAVAALARIRFLHVGPDAFGELQALGLVLLRRADGAEQLVHDFVGRLDLANDFMLPFLGYMAVRAGGAHPGTVAVMYGLFVFLEHEGFHFVAGDTELLGVGGIHGPVKAYPENAGQREYKHDDGAQCVFCRRLFQRLP